MYSEIQEVPEVFARLDQNAEPFNRAVAAIKSREIKNVVLIARGTSSNAGQLLKSLLEVELGLPVGIISPSSVSLYGAKLAFQNTLAITLSQSGRSPDLVATATAAKAGGALLISATNNSDSPLAKLGDLHIDLNAGPEIAVAATKSFSAELFVSLKLATALKSGAVKAYPEIIADTRKNLGADFSELISELDSKRSISVIGRGFGYCNTRELALKIQETSYIPVQGMTTSDFIHGPITALDKNSQILIISPSGTPKNSLSDAVARIREVGSTIAWIGSGESAERNEIVIPGSSIAHESESIVADSVLMQLLALHFAAKNGTNPDNPRGLEKITLTK